MSALDTVGEALVCATCRADLEAGYGSVESHTLPAALHGGATVRLVLTGTIPDEPQLVIGPCPLCGSTALPRWPARLAIHPAAEVAPALERYQTWARAEVAAEVARRTDLGVEVAPGVTVALTLRDLVYWLGALVLSALILLGVLPSTVLAWPQTVRGTGSASVSVADASALLTLALQCVGVTQGHREAGQVALAAIDAATTVDEVDDALLAYLGAP